MIKQSSFPIGNARSPSFRLPTLARRPATAPLLTLGLIQLLSIAGCEAILHIGRIGEKVADADAGAGGNTGGNAPDGSSGDAMPPQRPLPPAHPPLTSASKLDLLFVIDDSVSMAPLQAKMRARMPEFMNVLKNVPGGLPDLHVAVVSTSLGAGIFSNVPGCAPNSTGNLNGAFQHRSACTQLLAGNSFIRSTFDASGARSQNFTGDIAEVFNCIADIGDFGCGFEHPFEATRLALQRTLTPGDQNAGFLRADAYLAIVMLANEDDCSVPADSDLFDPGQFNLADPYGGLQSYRCNEFGHLCGGQKPPHASPVMAVTLDACVSNENGPLVSVAGFVDFLFSLKPGRPERIFVGALAGPPTPYVVAGAPFTIPTGAEETQPRVQHSCSSTTAFEFADPAVRIKQWTSAFGPNSLFASICADDFGPIMTTMAQTMVAP